MLKFFNSLFGRVVIALVAGIVIGALFPHFAQSLRPLGDGFLKLIKMVIGPIVFCVVVSGMAHAGDLKKVGRVGLKAVVYFEFMTTIALVIGAVLAYVTKPGVGMNINLHSLDAASLTTYTEHTEEPEGHRRLSAEDHPGHGDQRFRHRRHPADPRVLGAVRLGAVAAR